MCGSMLRMFVKVLLQNDGSGLRIDYLAALLFNHRRGITFVHQHSDHAKPAMQLVGKTAAAHSHLVLGAIGMRGQADDAKLRLPLIKKCFYRKEFAVVGGSSDDGQWAGLTRDAIADSDTNTFQTEIETEQGSQATSRFLNQLCMAGHAGQHARVDTQQPHGGIKTPLYGRIKHNMWLCPHG